MQRTRHAVSLQTYIKQVKKHPQQSAPRRDTARRVRKKTSTKQKKLARHPNETDTACRVHTKRYQNEYKKTLPRNAKWGLKQKFPTETLWGIALKNVFYFTKTFLPLMIYSPLLEVSTFLPCKS